MAVIMGGGPHMRTFSSPGSLDGMCVSIISLVTNPVPCVQPAGGLLSVY